MAIEATVNIDAGIEMPVYIRILDLSQVTNHYGGGIAKVVVRGFLKQLIDSGDYTDFQGENPPPYCWGGEYGKSFDVIIDVSDKTTSIYEQAYCSLLINDEFINIVNDPVSV